MKARLIKDVNHRIVLLCNDGTIATASKTVLYDMLTDFRREDNYFTGKRGKWTDNYPDMSMYPGETLALIADNYTLVIYDFEPFKTLMNTNLETRGFISVDDFAKKYNKSTEIIKVYCRTGRIPGAQKVARNWLIPENAEYPVSEGRRREGIKGPRPHMRKNTSQKK